MRIAIVAALSLAGCATLYDLETRRPDARYVSRNTLPVLEQCILSAIGDLGQTRVERNEGETRITLSTRNAYPAALIVLRRTQSGSTVAVRQAISYNLGSRIERCL